MIRLLCFGHLILIVKNFATLPIHTTCIYVVRSDLVTMSTLPCLSVYFVVGRAREQRGALIDWLRIYISRCPAAKFLIGGTTDRAAARF